MRSARWIAAIAGSVALHGIAAAGFPKNVFAANAWSESHALKEGRIVAWVVPSPQPLVTPPDHWRQLDRSALKRVRLTPADEQIVVLAARQGNGEPSLAPHVMRVDVRPGFVHSGSIMHIRVLTTPDAAGVYVRFLAWEIGIPPIAPGVFPRSHSTYAGRPYERFERDYHVPNIPRWYLGRTYQVEIIAVGRHGIASGAFVPVRVVAR